MRNVAAGLEASLDHAEGGITYQKQKELYAGSVGLSEG
jgi:hypothetical protein